MMLPVWASQVIFASDIGARSMKPASFFPKALGEQRFGHRRQRHEPAIGPKRPTGSEHARVRVEVRQIPEGLHEQDQPRARAGCGFGVRRGEQPRGDATQLPQPRTLPTEHRAQQLRDGEHVLAVRHRCEHVRLDPLAVEQHAFLVAVRTEVPRLVRVREQVVVTAGVAVDARKAVVRITALDEAPDHLRFERAARAPGIVQLGGVALRAPPKRARAWPARAIQTAARRPTGPRRHSPPLSARAAARP